MPEGIFKCGKHDFSCDSMEELSAHNADNVHTIYGTAPCNQCGLAGKFTFTGKMGTKPPALCEDCKTMLLSGSSEE